MDGISQTTEGLLQAPLVHLQEQVDMLKAGHVASPMQDEPPSLEQVIQELDALIERAIRVRGYLDGRDGRSEV